MRKFRRASFFAGATLCLAFAASAHAELPVANDHDTNINDIDLTPFSENVSAAIRNIEARNGGRLFLEALQPDTGTDSPGWSDSDDDRFSFDAAQFRRLDSVDDYEDRLKEELNYRKYDGNGTKLKSIDIPLDSLAILPASDRLSLYIAKGRTEVPHSSSLKTREISAQFLLHETDRLTLQGFAGVGDTRFPATATENGGTERHRERDTVFGLRFNLALGPRR